MRFETLNVALEALKTPGLEQSEVLRLRSIIHGVKFYEGLFADYVDYFGARELLGFSPEAQSSSQ